MSILRRSTKQSLLMAVAAMPAFAATAERDVSGNFAIWVFLGFCALIVIAQLLPLIWHLSNKSAEQAAKQEPVLDKVPKN